MWFGLLIFFPACLIAVVTLPTSTTAPPRTAANDVDTCVGRITEQINSAMARYDTHGGFGNLDYQTKLWLMEHVYNPAMKVSADMRQICSRDPNYNFVVR